MGIFSKKKKSNEVEDIIEKIQQQRLSIDVLSYAYCVVTHYIARKFALAEFLFYENNKPAYQYNHYSWNVKPNNFQSAYEFKYEYAVNLLINGEALIVEKNNQMFVADPSFQKQENGISEFIFSGITKNGVTFVDRFKSSAVIYTTFPTNEIKLRLCRQIAGLEELITTAATNYELTSYQKGFIKINAPDTGDGDFKKKVSDLINNQFKPLFEIKQNAVLPLYEGMEFIDVNKYRSSAKRSEITDIKELIAEAIKEVCITLGVQPSALLGDKVDIDDAKNETNISAIKTIATMVEQSINTAVIGVEDFAKGKYAKINLAPITIATVFDNADKSDKLIASSQYSPDELRIARGDRPRGEWWSDKCFGTKNYELIPDEKPKKEGGEDNRTTN